MYILLKKIKYLTPFLVSVVIIALILKKINFSELSQVLRSVDITMIIFLTICMQSVVFLFSILRMQKVLRLLGCELSFLQSGKFFLGVLPISKLSPANSGDLIRSLYLKNQISPSKLAGSVLYERLNDFFVLAFLALLFGGVSKNFMAFSTGLLLIVGITGSLWLIKKVNWEKDNKIIAKTKNFFKVFPVIQKDKKVMPLLLLYTFLIWLAIISYVYSLFAIFGQNIEFFKIATLQPLVIFTSLLPITISGIGTREGAMLFLYSQLAPQAKILSISLIYSAISAILLPLIGLPFMFSILKKTIQNEKN